MTKRKPHAKPAAGSDVGARVVVGLFIACPVFGILAAMASHLDYGSAADVLGMLSLVAFGQCFFWGMIYSATTHGVIYSSKRRSLFSERKNYVRAVRQTQPIRYWAIASFFLLFGLAVTIAGVYLGIRRWIE